MFNRIVYTVCMYIVIIVMILLDVSPDFVSELPEDYNSREPW